ncbi:hypothetical protein TUM20985_31910 [Mycobacterium antarcticum]|uniref:hypothetical protein n=1 Tax=unclassified Mycolicibacterium TaxID=2636767 RepID=UPI0023962F39|nr:MULTISPECIES: hypothetical protein [unclassified Mycolicibacterium]BDX32644.1 hypothetical protein TUM20985_31910 [Mycolicibacterium sp. TUM20985]GLP83805.1 hypothetical protein TUM20984_52250 [Mycolicibacterium sp. TUM20984]
MLVFRAVPSDVGDAAALVAAMLDEMRALYWDLGAEGSGGLDLDAPDMPRAGRRNWVRRAACSSSDTATGWRCAAVA